MVNRLKRETLVGVLSSPPPITIRFFNENE
jgi:hypothetical protein